MRRILVLRYEVPLECNASKAIEGGWRSANRLQAANLNFTAVVLRVAAASAHEISPRFRHSARSWHVDGTRE